MSINPYESPATRGSLTRGNWSPTLVQVIAVVAIIGILFVLLLPARRQAGPLARRVQCANNLKQIALALLNYESQYGVFPPAYTVDENGKPLHSWRTLILPYVEQFRLYEKIDFTKPWDDPANKQAYDSTPGVYRCSSTNYSDGHTSYLAVVAPGGCFRPAMPRGLLEITDRHDLTLIVMETDRHFHWMSPTDLDEQSILAFCAAGKFPHSGGAMAVSVDSTVLTLGPELTAENLRALITIDGHDDVDAIDLAPGGKLRW